jgi:DegV family protein with EDD domain
MANVAVLTDSVASLPETFLKNLNITTVAYYIHRGEEVLRDLVTIQREEFLRWMITAKFVPTTASPGPGDYFNAYKHLIEAGHREIISIHMTAKASGGFQAAALAQSMLKESDPEINLEVIDSRTTSLSQGWMVLEAARAALAGLRLNEITDIVKNMIPISHMIQTADTLRYLYLGGRIGKAQSLLGSMLNIKPLIGIENGEIAPLGKAHSRGQAYQQMAEMMAQAIGQGKAKVAYVHAGALHEVEKIKELVETKVNVVESMFAELSPALAVHTGPGTAGLCYYPVKD